MGVEDLGEVVAEKPFTVILSLIGLMVGLLLPSGLDVFAQLDYTNIEEVIKTVPVVVIIELISGLLGTLTGLLLGLVADFVKDSMM